MPPFDQIAGPLGGLFLAVISLSYVAREYRKQVNESLKNLRADMEYHRTRAHKAEERLDAFREQNEEMTNVLREAIQLAQGVLSERRR